MNSLQACLSTLDAPPSFQDFEAYWESRGINGVVERSNIDPIDMKQFLSGLFICHRTPNGFLYDLVGTSVCSAHDREITGLYLQDVVSAQRYADVNEVFDWVANGGAAYHVGHLGSPGREHIHFKRLYVPLVYRGNAGIIGLNSYVSNNSSGLNPGDPDLVHLIRLPDGGVERSIRLAPVSAGGAAPIPRTLLSARSVTKARGCVTAD